MEISINKQGEKTFVTLNGRLDTTNATQFQNDITPLMEDENPDIEMDCTNMEYTSSQGLRLFLMLQKTVSSKGGKLVMKNMRPAVREVFDITGFSRITSFGFDLIALRAASRWASSFTAMTIISVLISESMVSASEKVLAPGT